MARPLALLLLLPAALAAQSADWQRITNEGTARASRSVDSVFIDRQLAVDTVGGGDFTAYLMARLGIRRLPPDFAFGVSVDTSLIRIGGRVADLPSEAKAALTPLVTWLGGETWLEGQVTLEKAGPQAVRFHLRSATIQGVPVPEALLASVMHDVGRTYPALTETGRDLLVAIPPGAGMRLVDQGVVLIGP
jgi:hypothetical protein